MMQKTDVVAEGLQSNTQKTGLRGRVTSLAVVLMIAHLLLEYSFNFLPVTYPLLIPKLGLSYGQIGTLVLAMTIAGTITQPLFGLLSDRSDPRLLTVGSILFGGVLMGLVGLMPSYGALAVLLVVAALGSAAFHPPAAALASNVPAGERGRAMSLFSVGGNLGAAISPALVGVGLSLLGLRGTTLIIPVTIATALVLWRVLRHHPALAAAAGPADATRVATADATGAATGVGGSARGSLVALLLMVVVVGSRSYFQDALMTYLPQWLQEGGWSVASAAAALTGFMVVLSFGSLVGGTLSDRFGRLRLIYFSMGLMIVGLWLMLATTGAARVAAIGLVGLAIGSSYPVTIVLAQEAFPHRLGLASSMVMGIGWLPAGFGAWVVGRIADRSGLTSGLWSLLLVPLVGVAAASLYYLFVGRRRLAVVVAEERRGRA